MNWLESIIYGLVSGLAEFLPISSRAHQDLLLLLFGASEHDPFRDFLVHGAMIAAIFSGCRAMLEQMRRESNMRLNSRSMHTRPRALQDLRLVRNAFLPMIIGILVLTYVVGLQSNLMLVSLFLIANGVILFVPDRMVRANRDARSMSGFDSFLMGIFGALSAIPGFSRVGCTTSIAVCRGADQRKALDWALLLSIPAIALFMLIDIFSMFSFVGIATFWSNFFGYILSAAGAYVGGYISILLMKFLIVRTGLSDFSYYCWGTALISFILYLIVV
ncbi:MAG: undecaprenyl-diphosphate phosphatase [Oscillospiraceae bacterium]|nr:undecaprenyl-diphosphate phosphatase [Oscillospiraceae bacterium]